MSQSVIPGATDCRYVVRHCETTVYDAPRFRAEATVVMVDMHWQVVDDIPGSQKTAKPRYVPGIPSGQSKGKSFRLTWETQFESAHRPTQPVKVSSTDIVKFPKASSLDVAKTIVDHFEVTKNQAAAIRRRTASMVSMEQSILTKIRRLLPVAVDGDGAIAALRRIDEFLSTFEARDCSTPFE